MPWYHLPVTRRFAHTLIAFLLLACLIWPFVEIVAHSNDSIFRDGCDTESTVAVILLSFEMMLLLPSLAALFSPRTSDWSRFEDVAEGSPSLMHGVMPRFDCCSLPLSLRI